MTKTQELEVVAWRWKAKGDQTWTYDPSAWFAEQHRDDQKMEFEPLVTEASASTIFKGLETKLEATAKVALSLDERLNAAEAERDALRRKIDAGDEAFIQWLRTWVKSRFGTWITHNTAKGARDDFRAARQALSGGKESDDGR